MMGRACRKLLRSVAVLGLLGVLLQGALGCASPQTRGQAEDEPEPQVKYDEVKVIGDLTDGVANAEPIPVFGVGLVTDLEGTGGGTPAGTYATILKDQLEKQGCREADKVLADPHNALVLVTAQIPAGSHKEDAIDVDVSLPPQSRATSLRGGRLIECPLFDFASFHTPNVEGSDFSKRGHIQVRAKGPLLVGFGDTEDAGRVKSGRIWGGGRVLANHGFWLVLKGKSKDQSRVAANVAERINDTFRGVLAGGPDVQMASVQNPSVIAIGVPLQYRHNLQRYMRVVRLIVYREAEGKDAAASMKTYRKRLAEDLLDPARTLTAALRLEALGNESIPVLKRGLDSPHILVRFCSAEALAYLGNTGGADELAHDVQTQWALRAYGLTALASLDESVSRQKLRELLTCEDAETRYGAFRALRVLDEEDSAIPGELMHGGYWLHRVAPATAGLVHISTSKRAEIVLFGEDAVIKPGSTFLAGDFVVGSAEDDTQRCTISHVSVEHGRSVEQCSLKLEDVLRTMDRMGARYSDVVELIRQVDSCHCLSCAVRNDALPQAADAYKLVKAGHKARRHAASETVEMDGEAEEEIVNTNTDLLSTPTLFDQKPASREEKPRAEKKTAAKGE